MTGNGQGLGKKVRDVLEAADELDTEVSLADAVPDPVQAHVRGLGHALRDGVGCDADDHLVERGTVAHPVVTIFLSAGE